MDISMSVESLLAFKALITNFTFKPNFLVTFIIIFIFT